MWKLLYHPVRNRLINKHNSENYWKSPENQWLVQVIHFVLKWSLFGGGHVDCQFRGGGGGGFISHVRKIHALQKHNFKEGSRSGHLWRIPQIWYGWFPKIVVPPNHPFLMVMMMFVFGFVFSPSKDQNLSIPIRQSRVVGAPVLLVQVSAPYACHWLAQIWKPTSFKLRCADQNLGG